MRNKCQDRLLRLCRCGVAFHGGGCGGSLGRACGISGLQRLPLCRRPVVVPEAAACGGLWIEASSLGWGVAYGICWQGILPWSDRALVRGYPSAIRMEDSDPARDVQKAMPLQGGRGIND
jgi:hypothetical protein